LTILPTDLDDDLLLHQLLGDGTLGQALDTQLEHAPLQHHLARPRDRTVAAQAPAPPVAISSGRWP
jgi:hypothetical protein